MTGLLRLLQEPHRKGKILYSKVFTPTFGSGSRGVIEEVKADVRYIITAITGKEVPKEEWPVDKLNGWELAESTFPELEKIFRALEIKNTTSN